jgi:hypothetical protein
MYFCVAEACSAKASSCSWPRTAFQGSGGLLCRVHDVLHAHQSHEDCGGHCSCGQGGGHCKCQHQCGLCLSSDMLLNMWVHVAEACVAKASSCNWPHTVFKILVRMAVHAVLSAHQSKALEHLAPCRAVCLSEPWRLRGALQLGVRGWSLHCECQDQRELSVLLFCCSVCMSVWHSLYCNILWVQLDPHTVPQVSSWVAGGVGQHNGC